MTHMSPGKIINYLNILIKKLNLLLHEEDQILSTLISDNESLDEFVDEYTGIIVTC